MPPYPNISVKCAGELAFDFAEDGAGVVLEKGTMVHTGQDAIEGSSVGLRCPVL